MKTKHLLVALVIIAIASIGSIAAYSSLTNDSLFPLIFSPGSPMYDYVGGGSIDFHDIDETVYNDVTGDYRPDYVNLSDEEYEWIFGELPEFKQDFFSIVELIYDGKITDYERVSEEYWKQPEFYVGWFGCYSNNYPFNDPEHWGVEGYSFFPMIKEVIVERGTTFYVNGYFRTGYAIETYQGLIVHPYFPVSAKNILGGEIFVQPDNAEQYLTPSILNPDDELYNSFKDGLTFSNVGDEDWFVILKPTYSVVKDKEGKFIQYTGFPGDWVRLISIQVEVSENTPPGDYVVGLDIITPCFEINQEYYYSVEHEYFGKYYFPVSHLAKSNIPNYQLIIRVE